MSLETKTIPPWSVFYYILLGPQKNNSIVLVQPSLLLCNAHLPLIFGWWFGGAVTGLTRVIPVNARHGHPTFFILGNLRGPPECHHPRDKAISRNYETPWSLNNPLIRLAISWHDSQRHFGGLGWSVCPNIDLSFPFRESSPVAAPSMFWLVHPPGFTLIRQRGTLAGVGWPAMAISMYLYVFFVYICTYQTSGPIIQHTTTHYNLDKPWNSRRNLQHELCNTRAVVCH